MTVTERAGELLAEIVPKLGTKNKDKLRSAIAFAEQVVGGWASATPATQREMARQLDAVIANLEAIAAGAAGAAIWTAIADAAGDAVLAGIRGAI